MINLLKICIFCLCLFVLADTVLSQQIEYKDGIKYIHNDKPLWGKEAKVSLEFVQTLGGVDVDDEDYLMFKIQDIERNSKGDIYILDGGNHRVQIFNSKGKYKKTFGEKGQGPGEFEFPTCMALDGKNNLYVLDRDRKWIVFNKRGKEIRRARLKMKWGESRMRFLNKDTIIMGGEHYGVSGMDQDPEKTHDPLYKLYDSKGNLEYGIGKRRVFKINRSDNLIRFAEEGRVPFEIDKNGHVWTANGTKNRIEKLDEKGNILFVADRKLNYDVTEYVIKGKWPIYPNIVSKGIGIDSYGRIWVATLIKQPKKEFYHKSLKKVLLEFEIFSQEGILLGKVPMPEDLEKFRIEGDRIYCIGIDRVSVSEYKIVEK